MPGGKTDMADERRRSSARAVDDAADIQRPERLWPPRSLADELAAIRADGLKRRNTRDRALVKLRVAQADRGAVEIRCRSLRRRSARARRDGALRLTTGPVSTFGAAGAL